MSLVRAGADLRTALEELRIRLGYYRHPLFRDADRLLRALYMGESPYQISRRYWSRRGDADTYGETFLSTMEKVTDLLQLTPDDRFYELGCGRGRGALWSALARGCQVHAIECIPDFVVRGQKLCEALALPNLSFEEADLLDIDYSQVDAAYLSATCMRDSFLEQLAERLEAMPSGARLVSVSTSILDYQTRSSFVRVKKIPASFAWGRGTLFLQRKR